jgi:hypothetical protein
MQRLCTWEPNTGMGIHFILAMFCLQFQTLADALDSELPSYLPLASLRALSRTSVSVFKCVGPIISLYLGKAV